MPVVGSLPAAGNTIGVVNQSSLDIDRESPIIGVNGSGERNDSSASTSISSGEDAVIDNAFNLSGFFAITSANCIKTADQKYFSA